MDQATPTMSSLPQQQLEIMKSKEMRYPLTAFLKSKRKIGKGDLGSSNRSAYKRIASLNLEDIKIGSQIGKGFFTKVHAISSVSKTAKRAMDRTCSGNTQFVIKRLRISASAAGEKVRNGALCQLIGEATLLAQLDHPQIASLRAFVAADCCLNGKGGGFALIIDRWDCTLRERIDLWSSSHQERKEDASFVYERLCHALEIAEAMEYIHHRRLIYRALEPRNIGLTKENSIQLFDFGLCRRLPSKSQASSNQCYHMTYAGTARYLAPEVHRRTGYNRKADVYSWAIVCYELLSLTEPYHGMSRGEHFAEVCDEGFRPCMDDLPSCTDLEDLLHCSWCDDLTERLKMKQVCARLEDIVASIDPEADSLSSNLDGEYDDDKHESCSTFSTLSDYSWLTDEDSIVGFDDDEDDDEMY